MKTHLLRNANPVEPQKATRASRPRAVTAPEVLGRPGHTFNEPVLFIGLDMHTDSIAVTKFPF